jgi:D-3-phosphoglycerate dehydrogenase
MKDKIFECLVIPSPSFSKHPVLVQEAGALAKKIILNKEGVRFREADLLQFMSQENADAAIIGTDPLSEKVISKLTHIKAIGKYGVGLDNVDLAALKKRGIHFGWEGGVNKRSVSELALGFMLGHQRNIFRSINRMQNGEWTKNGGFELSNKTVGIVGFGHIGTDLASLLKPFGCKILVHDILDKNIECKTLDASQVSYPELLKLADIITFHVPGGEPTKNMFSQNEIALAKPFALVINTARGSIIDFDAVTNAVKTNRLGGYASDVFPTEPLTSKDFSVESGFYFTPHIGGNTDEAILAMGRAAIRGLKEFLG